MFLKIRDTLQNSWSKLHLLVDWKRHRKWRSALRRILLILFFVFLATPPSSLTTYSGSLYSSNTFSRPGGGSGHFNYRALEVTVSTSGRYFFTSTSSMDSYGYFYSYPFDPSVPYRNLISQNDDSGNSTRQFGIDVSLQYGRTYVLVVTTYAANTRDTFLITVYGPARVGLTSITPSSE